MSVCRAAETARAWHGRAGKGELPQPPRKAAGESLQCKIYPISKRWGGVGGARAAHTKPGFRMDQFAGS